MNTIKQHEHARTRTSNSANQMTVSTVGNGAWAGGYAREPAIQPARADLVRAASIGAGLLALAAAALTWLVAAIGAVHPR